MNTGPGHRPLMDDLLLIVGQGVVIEEDFLQPLRLESIERPFDLVRHIAVHLRDPAVEFLGIHACWG